MATTPKTNSIKVRAKRLSADAVLPKKATADSAAFDIHALIDGAPIQLFAGQQTVINTGIALEIPSGYVGLIYSRSGHGFDKKVRLSNCVGVIDSDYRGEIKVALHADQLSPGITIEHGARIAQIIIQPAPAAEFIEVDELTETERGENGFGSTGA